MIGSRRLGDFRSSSDGQTLDFEWANTHRPRRRVPRISFDVTAGEMGRTPEGLRFNPGSDSNSDSDSDSDLRTFGSASSKRVSSEGSSMPSCSTLDFTARQSTRPSDKSRSAIRAQVA